MIELVNGADKKHRIMQDTWGHMYPEPGCKYPGSITAAIGEYGDMVIIATDFPNLQSSPQRFALERTIFDYLDLEEGRVAKIQCTLWFFKSSSKMFMGERIGKIIKIKADYLT